MSLLWDPCETIVSQKCMTSKKWSTNQTVGIKKNQRAPKRKASIISHNPLERGGPLCIYRYTYLVI